MEPMPPMTTISRDFISQTGCKRVRGGIVLEHRQKRSSYACEEGTEKRQLFLWLEQIDAHRLRRDLIVANCLESSSVELDQK